ncbi:MAG TPA: choice-of-anchor J domain-containing protein [Kofleriaceae bacterium]|nr:choice-of-anchor J domain-containing protein [Kofleriaceae bacterium]
MVVRARRLVVAGCLLASLEAHAVVPTQGPQISADALTAMPAAGTAKPLRVERKLEWAQAPSAAWSTFAQRHTGWQAGWDRATGVPSRMWGPGIAAPGSVADPATAERIARQVLADHLALFAPGSQPSDFELVSNHFDGSMRTLGFIQRSGGIHVIGGQISFRFKADRLFLIGSEALPNVSVATTKAKLAPRDLQRRATEHLRTAVALPNAPVTQPGDVVILPLVADDAVLGYRLARPVTIDGGGAGRYVGYADASTGDILALRQLNAYATGVVNYHVVDRYPERGRLDLPAKRAHVTVNGAAQTTSATGVVSWSDGEASVATGITGDLAAVVNKATGNAEATALYALQPGSQFAWDASGSESEDAQVNAYVATMIAKDYVRANIDANMRTLDEVIPVNVNIANSCNAFFDGKAINFYQSNMQCQNTALIQDVVYHEYGHRVHTAEIIDGVGDFDGAMSEGAADFLAATITGDHGMGRGFFRTSEALRDLDPDDKEWLWPQDIGEIHHTGMIFGGAFWDLRKGLIADLGEAPGIQLTNRLYVAALRRAVSIPTALVEVLAEDDDDGDLSNGTPHECTIRAAFGRHGLRTASGRVVAPGQLTIPALAIGVQIQVSGLSDRCNLDQVQSAFIDWVPSFGEPHAGTAEATPAGPNAFFAQLPLAQQESIYYKARVKFADGSSMTLADNLADPYYQLYQGRTVKLYCTDFESTDPFAEGWTTGTDKEGASPFEWGTPTTGPTDPHAAFSGSKIVAQKLDGDYNAEQDAWLKTPVIDIGQYSDVRLHYRRWLAVEDGHFDKAQIMANGKKAWQNYDSDLGDSSAIHHVDREWRFHDVPLSGYISGHTAQVTFDLASDAGLELGGWHIDDVCIVANPYAICGDGVRTRTEQCDNGGMNADVADTCHTDCHLPTCGDSIIDSDEECDDGALTDTCSSMCKIIEPVDTGCCSASGGGGSITLAGAVGMLLLRRRRRRTRV